MPKTLRSGERELVLKVKNFCEREKANKAPFIPLQNVRSRVAAMTGISEKMVTKISQEGAVAASTSTKISTPAKSRPHEKRVKLDDFDLCIIRHKVHEFYTVRKEVPTLTKLLNDLKVDINFNGLAMAKCELYEIIKEHKEQPTYEVDSYLTLHGHKSLRLPPYHCDLNPIEMIWSVTKKRVAEKNVGQESKNIVHLTEEAFDGITSDIWKRECDHVRGIEEKYYVNDLELDNFIIEVRDSETSSDSDCDSIISVVTPIEMDHSY